ncbi:MAG: single-stranded-DNA-specific exonuclease RecJ [Coriobacteriales bacterium]|jgi:single-stranded-DNA-specific exonuclease|nr:single-stranded-DNA-specific exonuclease RecJ [Coriobacteriales bacterium]
MRWIVKSASLEAAQKIEYELGIPLLVARILVARGICTPEEARDFVAPSLERSWLDPELIQGMQEVVDRLEAAIRQHKRIVIFGDYDVDGITAAAVMVRTLRELGSAPQVVLPRREGEGYGLSPAALERVRSLNPDMLVTVDCGVSNVNEVVELQQAGIEVVITDHHEDSGKRPPNTPLVDPKLVSGGPSATLAGVGVVLKLVQLLGRRFSKIELWRSYLDLATLGTLADQMPLKAENRALVAAGLEIINNNPRPGIAALLAQENPERKLVSSNSLAFGLIPRLNAAGRIRDPLIALDLLINDESRSIRANAQRLEELNRERRILEKLLFEQALQQAEGLTPNRRITVVGGEQWHEGVRGIVASRLVRHYQMPVIVFSLEGDVAVGSGRSYGQVNLHQTVAQLEEMLLRFGGHAGAIGLTIATERLSEFRERLEAILATEPAELFDPRLEVDAEVGLADMDLLTVAEMDALEPYGSANREPKLIVRSVFIRGARAVGATQNHLVFKIFDGLREFSAIWFNCPDVTATLSISSSVDIVFTPKIDEWHGHQSVKLHVQDVLVPDQAGTLPPWLHRLMEQPVETHNSDTLRPISASGNAAHSQPSTHTATDQELAQQLYDRDIILHPAQQQALQALELNKATLAVMATGRGKSLIFQLHAVKRALSSQCQSIFIYPLRALLADQEYALRTMLGRLGLSCVSINGATPLEQRRLIYERIAAHEVDIVLTTPEFALFNSVHLFNRGNFGFIAIDEAHHIATATHDFRPDYQRLARLRTLVPEANVLACTATADDAITQAICASLAIETIVSDTSIRSNLQLDDQRNAPEREYYLANILAYSSKAIVYVNSRSMSIELCKLMRKLLPQRASRLVFYHGGLTRDDRSRVEAAFRSGEADTIIATSAFGEGVNVPDIRDVVLYDLPFSLIDYNQMSGRAGRDGQSACIHLLAQPEDQVHNRRILDSVAPTREQLVGVWRCLQDLELHQPSEHVRHTYSLAEYLAKNVQPNKPKGVGTSLDSSERVSTTPVALATAPVRKNAQHKSTSQVVNGSFFTLDGAQAALAVFDELGLITPVRASYDKACAKTNEDSVARATSWHYRLNTAVGKVDLTASARYAEGLKSRESFDAFAEWLFTSGPDELLSVIQRPIVPHMPTV